MDKRNIKGQSAVEFLVLLGFLLMGFVLFAVVISHRTDVAYKEKDIIIGEDLVTKIQQEVSLANRVQDGYIRNFTLPVMAGKREYELGIKNETVFVTIRGSNFSRTVPPVQGQPQKGLNIIQRKGGVLILNE